MTNTQMDLANEEINRRAFDRCWDWFFDHLCTELFEDQEPHPFTAEEDALYDAAFEKAEESGELEAFLEPEGHHYTMAYNREEAEYLFHVLAARADDGPLDAHFEFLKPFGITPENIDDEESDDHKMAVAE